MTTNKAESITRQARKSDPSIADFSMLGLERIPDSFFKLDREAIKQVYLYGNKLKSIPAYMGEFKNVFILDISGNGLTGLPVEIGQMESLQGVYASGNVLKSIPKQLGLLLNLTWLNLRDNNLQSLPIELKSLSNLATLYISGNNFKHKPNCIKYMSKITWHDFGELKYKKETAKELNNE